MSLKDTLTNEQLSERFDNPFGLVNYAISLAKIKVARGEGVDSNPAAEVLELIADREDHLEFEEPETEEEVVVEFEAKAKVKAEEA